MSEIWPLFLVVDETPQVTLTSSSRSGHLLELDCLHFDIGHGIFRGTRLPETGTEVPLT